MKIALLPKLFLLLCMSASVSAQAQNLVSNGDFEAGLTDWNPWAAPANSFWNGVWLRLNDCDIWVPTNGCPFEGSTSHSQKKGSDAGNAHGGLTQVISVEPGKTYDVSGQWSGGVRGNLDGSNGSWWEINIFEGLVDDATIDTGLRPQDTLIAKIEANNLGSTEVFQYQWQEFSGSFTAESDTVTLVLKAGSFFTLEAAAYHDNIQVIEQVPPSPVPLNSTWMLVLLGMALLAVGFTGLGRRGHSL